MTHCQRRDNHGASCWLHLGGTCDCRCDACVEAKRPTGAFSVLQYVDTSKLTDDERAELERLQAEINATVARIQAAHAPWLTPVEYVDRDELAARYPVRR